MKADWLNLDSREPETQTVLERLNNAPFDELVEIDMINDRSRNIYHVDGKYFVPILDGGWVDVYQYCTEHMIHPEDRQLYAELMDPDTLHERLAKSEIDGVLSAELRYKTVEGKWLWTRQVLVSGARNGLPDGIVYCYIFDIDVQKQRELGRLNAAAPAAPKRDDITGLLLEKEFFALAQKKLAALTPGQWCVMAVDIENFKLFCDWHGQQVGKLLLAEIGEILQDVERHTGGLAGYHGQDDFALLAPYDVHEVNDLFERIRALIASKGDFVGFQPIFGICVVEDRAGQIVDLYNHAALTAEQIKGDFRNRIRVYNADAHKRNSEEYRIISQFQRALD